MPTSQNQNYHEMWDAVLKKFPLYDTVQVKQDINDILRGIIARRAWSGLVKYAILSVPAQVTTGTVSVVKDSNVVTGVGTTWPVSDLVSTTLAEPNIETGIIDLTPTSMASIRPGQWLILAGGAATEEGIFVISVDATTGTFRANCSNIQTAGATITGSSYAGRQFRLMSNTPFVTVMGFTSPTRMLIDRPWPYSTLSDQSYEITLVWASFGQDCKEVLTMVNPDRQYQFRVNCQKAEIDASDPRRAISQMPYKLAFHESDPAGSPLYELWPRPVSLAAYPYFYIKQWTPLENDNDMLPNGIRSDVIVKLAKAEAAQWPGHKKLDGGIYYDPPLAIRLQEQAEIDIQYMKNEDDSTAVMQMVYKYQRWPYGGPGPDYYQTDYESYYV